MLPPEIYENLIRASLGFEKIRPEYSDTIAVARSDEAITFNKNFRVIECSP